MSGKVASQDVYLNLATPLTVIGSGGGAPVPNPSFSTVSALGLSAPIDLQLDPATHRVSGSSGVNRIAGSYQIAGKRISFGPFIGTRMAGTPEAMKFESDYLNVLGKIDEWSLTDGKLELRAGPEIMATYLPVPPTSSGVASPAQ